MFFDSFFLMVPILFLVAGGFLLSKIYRLSQDTLVKAITDFLMPMLIFSSLCASDITGRTTLELLGIVSLVVFGLLGIAAVYCKVFNQDVREFAPPVIFMNSGFIGIPLMKLWGGVAAMNVDIIYDQIQTLYIFTLGLLIITGGFSLRGFKEIIKAPIFWAIVAGFGFRVLGVRLPAAAISTLEFGGNAAPPLAALALGVALGETKIHFNVHVIAALVFRAAGGFFVALLGCRILGITGLVAQVCVVTSALPAAVFSSVLPLRYGIRADFAGTVVVLSTIIGAVTIPLSFAAAARLFG